MGSAPKGQRFSHVYREKGEPVPDSSKMRRRLFELTQNLLPMSNEALASNIRSEIGTVYYGQNLWQFFHESHLDDVVDSITVLWKMAICEEKTNRSSATRGLAGKWIASVSRIFKEENVGYTVDDQGGVHLSIDKEFEAARIAAIKRLDAPRYGAVRNEFEKCYSALDAVPTDTKGAVRACFESIEILFKLMMTSKCQRLGVIEVKNNLQPLIDKIYSSDQTAKNVAGLLVNSFSHWVNSVHFYRHGQATEEPTPPPIEVAVAIVGQGATWLRWLLVIDGRLIKSNERQQGQESA